MAQLIEAQPAGIEVADIIRDHIQDYLEKYPLLPAQHKVVYDLLNCRTSYLGGHIEKCDHCGNERIAYNSCRNRHCPKCQSMPRERWLAKRKAELLPVMYFHCVFTLPHELNTIVLYNKKMMLNILFQAVSATLLTFGKNRPNGLGGMLGFIAILHTWDQLLKPHFHLHCLVPGGAVNETRTGWLPCKKEYLFNVKALGVVFRAKFMVFLTQAFAKGELVFPGILAELEKPDKFQALTDMLYAKKWVVYVKEPLRKPEYVLEYLGRYTHRVAISNHRIVAHKDGKVTFRYKNRENNQTQSTTMDAVEFIRRFLLHTLPKGFVRIRHYGFLSNRNRRANMVNLLGLFGRGEGGNTNEKSIEEMMLKLTGVDITRCPCCRKGNMQVVAHLPEKTGVCPANIVRTRIYRQSG